MLFDAFEIIDGAVRAYSLVGVVSAIGCSSIEGVTDEVDYVDGGGLLVANVLDCTDSVFVSECVFVWLLFFGGGGGVVLLGDE